MPGPSLLVVDDEKALLAILGRFLERAGYRVECCETGAAALARFAAAPRGFDVVILDLKLPDLPGEEVLRRLLELSPVVRVLVSSGTPFAIESVEPRHRQRVDSLLKPFLPKMLEAALRRLLAK
jgi:two-component system KDP operon response regulator KdpE